MSSVTLPRSRRSWIVLIAFVVIVTGVGGLLGVLTVPGGWYAGLNKPPFNPPNWLFGPVWTTLYVLIAIAGWRTFERDARSPEMGLWVGQMLFNWLWSPVFFALHWLWPAVAVILVMLALILAFIARTWSRDRTSAWLFVPYAAWVSFAALLNISVAALN